MISESLYTDVSKESIRNSVISEIGYQYKYENFNRTDSYEMRHEFTNCFPSDHRNEDNLTVSRKRLGETGLLDMNKMAAKPAEYVKEIDVFMEKMS